MCPPDDELINFGAFVPTTNVWEISQLQSIDLNSPEFRDLLVRLWQNVNTIALSVNIRDAGFYDQTEFMNGQLFFPNPALSSQTAQAPDYRQVFRKVINFGSLPNASSKSVAHGIDIKNTFSFTRIYGCSSDQVSLKFIPIPYASPINVNNVSIDVDATNVTITTGTNRTNFTITYAILECIKN